MLIVEIKDGRYILPLCRRDRPDDTTGQDFLGRPAFVVVDLVVRECFVRIFRY